MNIKKVSEQTGVSADTIRYYERIGLLPRVRRNKSGVRDFSEQDIAALEFIRCFRSAGMSVESLIEYMSLVEEGEGTEKARMKILEEQREKLISRIAELQAAKKRLDYKIENYKNIILKKEESLFEEGTAD
ncbi:MerR family transcriptional regulator [Streptococcus ruminicola]|uniref:MerR family transcriptional regulator n=1 Tax=Streptococcus ruminicola TaxID=2686210 RepID=A0A6G8I1M4_9STRE|nr:stress response transcriptional regulator NmlR [Streptococcus ruminicola]QIM46976.1 MerR family transcriptional regulator [Streptococcus ruminicola]WFM81074.1 MerR family transcriptional regulator [Streptococcus ruminicola]